MSLQGGWDRDSQAKKGGMAGLTGKMGGKAGSEKPIGDPQMLLRRWRRAKVTKRELVDERLKCC